jgi:acetyl-CoA carboxylase carboxyl transferase subunit alpha
MLEHSYYSVISPEGCASILWKNADKKGVAAEALKLNAENMLEHEVVDAVIKEPLGGAHHDVKLAAQHVLGFILSSWTRLKMVPQELLLEQRYRKFRKLGAYVEEEHRK